MLGVLAIAIGDVQRPVRILRCALPYALHCAAVVIACECWRGGTPLTHWLCERADLLRLYGLSAILFWACVCERCTTSRVDRRRTPLALEILLWVLGVDTLGVALGIHDGEAMPLVDVLVRAVELVVYRYNHAVGRTATPRTGRAPARPAAATFDLPLDVDAGLRWSNNRKDHQDWKNWVQTMGFQHQRIVSSCQESPTH